MNSFLVLIAVLIAIYWFCQSSCSRKLSLQINSHAIIEEFQGNKYLTIAKDSDLILEEKHKNGKIINCDKPVNVFIPNNLDNSFNVEITTPCSKDGKPYKLRLGKIDDDGDFYVIPIHGNTELTHNQVLNNPCLVRLLKSNEIIGQPKSVKFDKVAYIRDDIGRWVRIPAHIMDQDTRGMSSGPFLKKDTEYVHNTPVPYE